MAFKINSKNVLKKIPSKKVMGGNIEKEANEEVNEVISEFSKKAKNEKELFKENTDANYFTVITFNNHRQRDEFLNKVGLTPSDPQYIDGLALCKKLGITINEPSRNAPGSFRLNKGLEELIMD